MADTAIFDVDGTLVDSNYQHAMAWFRAFRRFDITPPLWRIHRGIGMGGDLFVTETAGPDVEHAHGDGLRAAWEQEFDQLIGEVQPFAAAGALLHDVKDRGFAVVLASSGDTRHVEAFLDLFGGRDIADDWTTSDDAERSKPEPDIVQTALAKVGGESGVMVGDSTWDCIAAGKPGSPHSVCAPVASAPTSSGTPAPSGSSTPWLSCVTTLTTPRSQLPTAPADRRVVPRWQPGR